MRWCTDTSDKPVIISEILSSSELPVTISSTSIVGVYEYLCANTLGHRSYTKLWSSLL